MPQFQPDQVTFRDAAGYGAWDTAHYREHLQFVQVLAAQTPPILLGNYDLSTMLTAGTARKSIQESHQSAHELLADITGITATDFSGFDLENPEDFYSFLSYHSTTHAQIRQFLGVT
jgi:hypothetical protein